jgi:hypothetical protein
MGEVMKRLRRLWLCLAIMGVFFTLGTPDALAHYVYQSGWTYRTSFDCEWTYSEISHGVYHGGYSKVEGFSAQVNQVPPFWTNNYCGGGFNRPAGYLIDRAVLYRWNGSAWAVCRDTGWVYNSSNVAGFTIWDEWSVGDWGDPSPCGAGSYQTHGASFEYNGGWRGGWLWSGAHWLPAY